jgi:hypothetical protein
LALAQQPCPPHGIQLWKVPFQRRSIRVVEIQRSEAGLEGRAIAVPPKQQQRLPDHHLASGELQQALQVVQAAELHATLLKPEQQVHLGWCDSRKPQPVFCSGTVDVQTPAQGGGSVGLTGIMQAPLGIMAELQLEQIALNDLIGWFG